MSELVKNITNVFKKGATGVQIFLKMRDLERFTDTIKFVRNDLFFEHVLCVGFDINDINFEDWDLVFQKLHDLCADALVHDRPGVTRDVISGNIPNRPWTVFDTAGLENTKSGIGHDSTNMAIQTIEKADAILFVVDGKTGLLPMDLEWAKLVHKKSKAPALLLINKSESAKRLSDTHDFYKLGFGEPVLISAEHKRGFDEIYNFMDNIAKDENVSEEPNTKIKIAILGQPNVGKSTFVNHVLGENRQIVKDEPGITRDTVKIPTHFYGRDIILMDTAGLRRKSGVTDDVETLSALKSLDAIDKANIVVLIVDATKNIENQTLSIAARVYDAGKILCIALNKWDVRRGHV